MSVGKRILLSLTILIVGAGAASPFRKPLPLGAGLTAKRSADNHFGEPMLLSPPSLANTDAMVAANDNDPRSDLPLEAHVEQSTDEPTGAVAAYSGSSSLGLAPANYLESYANGKTSHKPSWDPPPQLPSVFPRMASAQPPQENQTARQNHHSQQHAQITASDSIKNPAQPAPWKWGAGGSRPATSSTQTSRVEPNWRWHRIVDGDTLPMLAKRYLGSANRSDEIYALNRDILTAPDLLPIRGKIRIPLK